MSQDDVVRLALCKAYAEKAQKEIREQVDPGKYEVDTMIKIHGTLTVCEDHEAINVQKVCPWTLALIALNKLNVETRNLVIDEALVFVKSGIKLEALDDLKKHTLRQAEKLLGSTVETRKGVAKFSGCVEVLEEAAV
jgi:hypothetical protein